MASLTNRLQFGDILDRLDRLMEPAGPAAPPSEIASLTRGLAAGEEEAFRRFHALYFDRLLRYLLVVTRGDEEAARDALQETFSRVVRHARRFDQEPVFWSWLTVLARSAATDGSRRRVRYWRLLADYARSVLLPVSRQSDPHSDADFRLHELLAAGLETLEPIDRSLVEGKYLRQASIRELAETSGLSDKAVESRLVRARRALREHVHHALRHET